MGPHRRQSYLTNVPRCLAVLIAGWVSFLSSGTSVHSQTKFLTNVAPVDSQAYDNWSDETVYSIEILRLERWIQKNIATFRDSLLLQEVAVLKKEVEDFAERNDYTMAVIWLETIWGLLLPEDSQRSHDLTDELFVSLDEIDDELFDDSSASFTWSRELTSGVDLWRQQFRFAFVQEDSTIVEGNGNPFTGIRLNFDYRPGERRSLQGYAAFKYSRDYLTGEADLEFSIPAGRLSRVRLVNRFEGNSFYGQFDLQYVQNVSEIAFDLRELGPISLDLEDEFLVRRYGNDDPANPSYFNNSFRGLVRLDYTGGSFMGMGYRNVHRIYSTHDEFDYQEHLLEGTLYQRVADQAVLSVDGELRWRDYAVAGSEILQDYQERYFRTDLRLPLVAGFGLEIQGSMSFRDYEFVNATSLPDYLSWNVEPEAFVDLSQELKVSAGFFYAAETYQELSTIRASQAVDADISIPFENNVSYGPVFAIEFFQFDGITFSVRELLRLQRYPETETDNLFRSNPYSDRNVNSLLIYLTWNPPGKWRLTTLANVDHDQSRRNDSSEFQNTIVGFEINYSF